MPGMSSMALRHPSVISGSSQRPERVAHSKLKPLPDQLQTLQYTMRNHLRILPTLAHLPTFAGVDIRISSSHRSKKTDDDHIEERNMYSVLPIQINLNWTDKRLGLSQKGAKRCGEHGSCYKTLRAWRQASDGRILAINRFACSLEEGMWLTFRKRRGSVRVRGGNLSGVEETDNFLAPERSCPRIDRRYNSTAWLSSIEDHALDPAWMVINSFSGILSS